MLGGQKVRRPRFQGMLNPLPWAFPRCLHVHRSPGAWLPQPPAGEPGVSWPSGAFIPSADVCSQALAQVVTCYGPCPPGQLRRRRETHGQPWLTRSKHHLASFPWPGLPHTGPVVEVNGPAAPTGPLLSLPFITRWGGLSRPGLAGITLLFNNQ